MWRLLTRRSLGLPYGKETKPIDEFGYEEHVDGTDHSKYLWMNAAYSLGTAMTNRSLSTVCASPCGSRGWGAWSRAYLPTIFIRTKATSPEVSDRSSITDRREKRTGDLDFFLSYTAKARTMRVFQRAEPVKNPSCTTPIRECQCQALA